MSWKLKIFKKIETKPSQTYVGQLKYDQATADRLEELRKRFKKADVGEVITLAVEILSYLEEQDKID